MTEIILLLIVNSFECYGFWNACNYVPRGINGTGDDVEVVTEDIKGILWFIPKYVGPLLPWWLSKPLYDCLPCMASIHGSIVYWVIMDWTPNSLVFYPIYILALSGINLMVDRKL